MNLEQLMGNPYAWLFLSFCTIFSVIYAVYMGIKSKEKKQISYSMTTNEIVRSGKDIIPGFQISYCNQTISNLTITRFAIWNSGNRLLNLTDIVETMPLSITSKENGAEILDASIIKYSEKSNKFSVNKKNSHCVEISFDYMDTQEGIILQILHTGSANDIYFTGKIKGGKKLKNIGNDCFLFKQIETKKELSGLIIASGFIACFSMLIVHFLYFIGIIPDTVIEESIVFNANANPSLFLTIMDVLSLIIASMCYMLLKRDFHLNIPSTLRDSVEYKN